jgi:hypothetical protein
MSTETTTTASAPPPTKKRTRKPRAKRHYLLVEVTEDEHTKQPCFAIVPQPPLPAGKRVTPKLIEEACRKAVYEDGQKQYGNKGLAVVVSLAMFDIPYVERLALTPPEKKASDKK